MTIGHNPEVNSAARPRKLTIKGSFIQRVEPDGSQVGIRFHGVVDDQMGSIDEVAKVVLEGEMHGNDGKTRMHIFLV